MLTYDHDGNYNIIIISNNNDDGDHFHGCHLHHHQHYHQHNHFSAVTASPSTDASSLPTTASSSIEPLSIPTAPVVTMHIVVAMKNQWHHSRTQLGWDVCSALAYLSSGVLCQLCIFITTTFATSTTGHMDVAFIICDIHFDRAVLMVKLYT